MVYTRFVEVGRVAYCAFGGDVGKLVVICDIIDQQRVLCDGPLSGVARKSIPLKQLHLTPFVVKIGPSARTGVVRKAWEKAEIDQKWAETTWAKKLAARQKRKELTDYERFKLMKAKQSRNRLISIEHGKLKTIVKKAGPKKLRTNKKPTRK